MREAELTGVRSGRIVAIEPTARRSNEKLALTIEQLNS